VTVGQAVLLGLIQGLTEFLPVSSSGHLVLGRTLLGIPEQGIAFEVFVHFGTLLAVITAFHRDLLERKSGTRFGPYRKQNSNRSPPGWINWRQG